MSKQFLVPITLARGTSNPSVGNLGDLFYREDLGSIMSFDGSDWVTVSGSQLNQIDGGNATSLYDISYDGGGPSTVY